MKKVFFAAAILLLWQLASMAVSKPMLPPPWKVLLIGIPKHSAPLLKSSAASLLRVLSSSVLAAAAGLACAVAAALYPKAEKVIYPFVYLMQPIPKIALLPIVMLLFGLGEASKILLLFLICFFPFALSAREAVMSVEKAQKDVFSSLAASKLDHMRFLILPAAAPALLEGWRLCLGTALSVLFFSESFGTQVGLGAFILDAWMRVSYVEMMSGIVVLALCGYGLQRVLDAAAENTRKRRNT